MQALNYTTASLNPSAAGRCNSNRTAASSKQYKGKTDARLSQLGRHWKHSPHGGKVPCDYIKCLYRIFWNFIQVPCQSFQQQLKADDWYPLNGYFKSLVLPLPWKRHLHIHLTCKIKQKLLLRTGGYHDTMRDYLFLLSILWFFIFADWFV